ncbi:MAG TPA: S8/S53 family peptidase [Bacteroidia bacterium]
MKRLLYVSLTSIFISNLCFSQTVYTRYWVGFTDKNNSAYTVSNPTPYLSARAIARRTNQSIAINNEDIPVDTAYIRLIRNTGALVMSRSRWFNGVIVKITNQSQVAAINALSCVASTKPLARVKASRKTIPAQASIISAERTQADTFNYGQSKNQIYMLNGECLHNKGYNGTGMQIGVIDEGFYQAHAVTVFDSLWHNHQVLAARDFYLDDTLNYTNAVLGGHGTYVLSCMAAYTSGQMIGTAPKANYYLLRSEIDSTEKMVEVYQWVSAIEYADSAGADVITSSLGYSQFMDTTQSLTWGDMNGRTAVASISATMAARRGMIVCVAAGNDGGCTAAGGPNCCVNGACWQKITVPADADSILTVGAVDGSGAYAFFSSTGNTADGRIKPDVVAQGQGTTIANSSGITNGNGTSFATPTLAGMVACLWQGNPTKTNMQVIAAIKQSASQHAHPDSLLGYGIPDFCLADQILKGIAGINELRMMNDELRIYPNPASSILNVECLMVNESSTLVITDILGNTLKQVPFNTQHLTLNINDLAAGMYIVKITSTTGNSYTKKLVKA